MRLGLGLGFGTQAGTGRGADPGVRTLALFGDSFMAQHTGASNRFENVGFMNVLNAMMGQRFVLNHALNFGTSGDDTTEMVARHASVVSSCTAAGVTDVAIMAGANDRTAKFTPTTSNGNMDTIVDAFTDAGIAVWLFACTPRRDASYTGAGFSAGEIVTAKDDTEACNAHLASKAMPGSVYFIDAYTPLVDVDRQCLSNVHADNLHINGTGAFYIMQEAYPPFRDKYGCYEFTPSPYNVLATTDFSGTGGVLTGATGSLAAGHTSIGSAPAGTSSRTFSKDGSDKQVMAFNFPSGGSTTDNMRAIHRRTEVYSGQTAYYECEVDLRNAPAPSGAGLWRTLSAEIQTSAGSLSIGNDREGTTGLTPVSLYRQFCIDNNRTMLIRTPALIIPTATYVEGRLNIEANTQGGELAGELTLINEQLVVSPTTSLADIEETAILDLDARSLFSYDGTTQLCRNRVMAPFDGTTREANHFSLGNTTSSAGDDPAFSGTAGTNTGVFTWSSVSANDFMQFLGPTTPFFRDMHKPDGPSFWFCGDFTFVQNDQTQVYFCTSNNASVPGLRITTSGAEKLQLVQRDDAGNNVIFTSTKTLVNNTDYIFVISHDQNTGITSLWIDNDAVDSAAHVFGASTTDANDVPAIGAEADGGVQCADGTKFRQFGAGAAFLDGAQAAAVIAELQARRT